MRMLSDDEICDRLVAGANDAIVYCDRAGKIRLWNASAELATGYRRQDVVGTAVDILIPKRLREAHWRGYCRAMVKGELAGESLRELTITCLDASELSAQASLTLHRDDEGEIVGVSAIFRFVKSTGTL